MLRRSLFNFQCRRHHQFNFISAADVCRADTVLKPIDITNLLWAAAALKVDVSATELWRITRARFAGPLRGWRVKELSSCLWSLGLMRLSPGHRALDTIVAKLSVHLDTLPPQHVVNSMTGVALLNHMPPRAVLEHIEGAISSSVMTVRCLPALPSGLQKFLIHEQHACVC